MEVSGANSLGISLGLFVSSGRQLGGSIFKKREGLLFGGEGSVVRHEGRVLESPVEQGSESRTAIPRAVPLVLPVWVH